jgi:hypothetical protein
LITLILRNFWAKSGREYARDSDWSYAFLTLIFDTFPFS